MSTEVLNAEISLLPAGVCVSPTKKRLYEVATEMFGTRGFAAASLRDLADALGIKSPSLYAHVSSKQQLLFELAIIGQTEHRDRLKEALLDAGADPVHQMSALVGAHVLVHLQLPLLARVTSVEIRHLDLEHLARLRVVRNEAERMFMDVLHRGIRRGAFDADNPARSMRAIADMGIRAAEWVDPVLVEDHQSIASEYIAIALRVVGARRTPPGA